MEWECILYIYREHNGYITNNKISGLWSYCNHSGSPTMRCSLMD